MQTCSEKNNLTSTKFNEGAHDFVHQTDSLENWVGVVQPDLGIIKAAVKSHQKKFCHTGYTATSQWWDYRDEQSLMEL